PPNDGNISAPRFPPAPPPAPVPPPELARKPLPQEGKIREQDLKSKSPAPNIPGRDGKDSSRPSSPAESSASPESTPAPWPGDTENLFIFSILSNRGYARSPSGWPRCRRCAATIIGRWARRSGRKRATCSPCVLIPAIAAPPTA